MQEDRFRTSCNEIVVTFIPEGAGPVNLLFFLVIFFDRCPPALVGAPE